MEAWMAERSGIRGFRRFLDFEVAVCVVSGPVLFVFCNQVRAKVEHIGFR